MTTALDRAGRICVEADFSVPGCADVYAIGDMVKLVDEAGADVPGMRRHASRSPRRKEHCPGTRGLAPSKVSLSRFGDDGDDRSGARCGAAPKATNVWPGSFGPFSTSRCSSDSITVSS